MQFLQNRVKIPDDQVVDTNQEMLRFGWSFFFGDYTVQPNTHNAHRLTPYENLQRLSRQNLEINEVTTSISLSMGTSPTTESTTPLNSKIFSFIGSRTYDLRCY